MKLFIFIITLISIRTDNIIKEDNVYILTDDTFDSFISSHNNVLVKFHAPWCAHCKKLEPEYKKAAYALQNEENIHLAQIDCTIHKAISYKYNIKRYPTIKLFSNGNVIDYKSKRTGKAIVMWMHKKTGPSTLHIESQSQMDSIHKDNDVYVAYFGTNESNLLLYESVAQINDDYIFITCSNETLYHIYNITKDTLVLFTHFDNGKIIMDANFTRRNIERFISTYSSPLLMPFNERAAQLLFTYNKPGLILYRDIHSVHNDEYESILKEAAIELEGKAQAVITDIHSNIEMKLAEYTHVHIEDMPTVRIVEMGKGVKKYIMKGDISKENVLQFVRGWKNKEIEPYYMSEEVPLEQKGNIYKVVGKNFYRDVIESERDVIVMFYTPMCEHCKKANEMYEQFARKYKVNEGLLIAECDCSKNEMENVDINGYPTFRLWASGKKDSPIDFTGKRTLLNFEKFINKYATHKLIHDNTSYETSDL